MIFFFVAPVNFNNYRITIPRDYKVGQMENNKRTVELQLGKCQRR